MIKNKTFLCISIALLLLFFSIIVRVGFMQKNITFFDAKCINNINDEMISLMVEYSEITENIQILTMDSLKINNDYIFSEIDSKKIENIILKQNILLKSLDKVENDKYISLIQDIKKAYSLFIESEMIYYEELLSKNPKIEKIKISKALENSIAPFILTLIDEINKIEVSDLKSEYKIKTVEKHIKIE
jgi:hypothetical protein